MNETNFKQFDTRWSSLPYPTKKWNIGNSGCGEVAICNSIIEMLAQANQTPKTIQPYCVQFAAPNGDGTYWSGIPKMLKNYGCTEVMEHQNMASLWNELAKGDRVAIYMMNNRPAGYLKKKWTSGGHFICSVLYRYNSQNGEHEVYIKDSNSLSDERNGWMSYESSLRGDVSACWSGKLNGSPSPTPTPPTPTPTDKLDVDGVGGYKTVKRLQEFLSLSNPDGLISGQPKAYKKYFPAITAVSYGRGGSNTIYALQKWLSLSSPDGILGGNTASALQRRLRDYGYLASSESIDGIIGAKTMRALQTALNNDFKQMTPSPTPTPTPTTDDYTKVIDISYVQKSVDWAKVKAAGIQGAIIRCGFRHAEGGKLDEDDMFLKHIKGASAVGLPVGIYFFTEAINAAEGREEAQYAINLWKKSGIPIWYPIGIDSEDVIWYENGKKCKGRANNGVLSKAKRTEAVKAFCEEIVRQGYTPMIYASLNWFDNCLDMSQLPYDVWVAQYNTTCQYKGKYIIWQYTSTGSVSGIKGAVDLDRCYCVPKKVEP